MVVLLHVLVALASIGFTGYTFFTPSKTKLRVSQGLVLATLTSGTYLVISTKAPLVSACLTGLVYLGVVTMAIVRARHKLASETINS